jgi:hypothetical protein
MRTHSRSLLAAILWGGIVAGTIDIGAACLISGRSVPYILHVIAGGLLGKQALAGGTGTALLGLLLQELMGILIAAIYVLASLRLRALRRRWILWGLAYGVVVYFVMNYVVLPLSAWHVTPPFNWTKFLPNLAAMLLFGLIVAGFGARRGGDRS